MNSRSFEDLNADVQQLRGRTLLVVGDVGVDEYVMGSVRRISPEAPVPILEVDSEMKKLGLSTNVAQNIASLGSTCLLVSVVGDDSSARDLRTLLQENHVSSEHLIVDFTRPTTRKTRILAQNHHLVRVDHEKRSFVSMEVAKKILNRVTELIPKCDGVILQDYSKGVLNEEVCQKVIELAKASSKPVFVDPNRNTPVRYYRGADLMTPNYEEALSLAGFNIDDRQQLSEDLTEIGDTLMQAIQSTRMVITRGKDGISIFESGQTQRIPTFAREVFDVTGAGDTVIAAITLGFVAGLGLDRASVMANYAAGVVVGKVGCVPCSSEELSNYIRGAG